MLEQILIDIIYVACDLMWNNPDDNTPFLVWHDMNAFFLAYEAQS